MAHAGARYIDELGSTMAGAFGPWGGGYDYSGYGHANYPDSGSTGEDWGKAKARLEALMRDIQSHFKYR